VMRAQASDGGMLPEQVWDGPDIPKLELFNGRATGGAMPLVWAHAEYAKLVRSLHDGRVFDMPQQPYERYVRNKRGSTVTLWAPHNRCSSLVEGSTLRLQLPEPATVSLAVNGEAASRDVSTTDTTLPGVFSADLDTAALRPGTNLRFSVRTAAGQTSGDQALVVVARRS